MKKSCSKEAANKRKNELQTYAISFLAEICKEFNLQYKEPCFYFYIDNMTAAFFDTKNNTITVHNIMAENTDELKQTIRHECLHFILYNNDLPARDEDIMFLLFAIAYNANPYNLAIEAAEKQYSKDKLSMLIDRIYDIPTEARLLCKNKLQIHFNKQQEKGLRA